MEERDLIRQGGVLVGYFEDGTAVLDSAFFGCDVGHRLIRAGRAVSWQPGIAKRLEQQAQTRPKMRSVRVWQLKPEADLNKKFIRYWELTDRFGGPSRSDYQMVFDGQLDTDHPEELYERFNAGTLPQGYRGHRLTISDLVEIYDESHSEFWYLDLEGFVPVAFETEKEDVE